MKNYEYLNILDYEKISDQIYNFLLSNFNLKNFIFWNDIDHLKLMAAIPMLEHTLHNMNLSIKEIAIIKTAVSGNIHVDYGRCPRILWPIKNCIGSENRFFDVKPEWLQIMHLKNGTPYYSINNPSPLIQIDQFELSRPVVFNPEIAHGVYCNKNFTNDRISMTIITNESLVNYLHE
jgi:hypothetical protein